MAKIWQHECGRQSILYGSRVDCSRGCNQPCLTQSLSHSDNQTHSEREPGEVTIEGVSAGADVAVHPALQVMAMKSAASAANIQKSLNSVGRMVCQYVEEVEEPLQGEQGRTMDRFNFGHMKEWIRREAQSFNQTAEGLITL